jgi:hypothetical protein
MPSDEVQHYREFPSAGGMSCLGPELEMADCGFVKETIPMEELRQTRRVTIRLTPWQARRLWQLRTVGLPEGEAPRTATEVLLRAITESTLPEDEEKSTPAIEAAPAAAAAQ